MIVGCVWQVVAVLIGTGDRHSIEDRVGIAGRDNVGGFVDPTLPTIEERVAVRIAGDKGGGPGYIVGHGADGHG